jgi:hypothetical protein
MSRAFMKEGEDQWLSDIPPTMGALLIFLTNENNGIRVVEEKRIVTPDGKEIYQMSNGLSYTKDADGRWMTVPYQE